MNTYDFDKTIFYPDSSETFVKWYLAHHPAELITWAPRMLVIGILYALHIIPTQKMKEHAFSFLRHVKDIDAVMQKFWDEHEYKIADWYKAHHKSDDVIISASPEFVVKPMADRLGVALIATRMDKRTGKISGANCHGEEKVRRFYEVYPGAVTEEFYSDSMSDTPMAKIAQKAFLIVNKGQTPIPWPNE